MFPVLIPMVGLGPVSIDADDIVRVDRRFGLGPKLFLKDGLTLITTPEALTRLDRYQGMRPCQTT
jgi:hypothetical protein